MEQPALLKIVRRMLEGKNVADLELCESCWGKEFLVEDIRPFDCDPIECIKDINDRTGGYLNGVWYAGHGQKIPLHSVLYWPFNAALENTQDSAEPSWVFAYADNKLYMIELQWSAPIDYIVRHVSKVDSKHPSYTFAE